MTVIIKLFTVMVYRLLIFLLCAGCLQVEAQTTDTLQMSGHNNSIKNKLSLSAYHEIAKISNLDLLPVLIKGDVKKIEGFIRTGSGKIKFSTATIVSALLSKQDILLLKSLEYVELIDCATGNLQTLNDVMVKHNNVDSAYQGLWPLDQGYDGTGVVIGVIDAPFDINHGDFKDAFGNTRIKYVWDQNIIAGVPPVPYDYGIECDSFMVANGTCPSNDFYELNYSHGSGVAGVAASSGNAADSYRGVAPNSDLILVSINFNDNFLTNLTDAIAYIYEKADDLNKPCVINTSLGLYSGSHDGKDLVAEIIDELIAQQNGRSLVAAAGNAGNFPFHLGYDVTNTEKFTWFKKLSYDNLVYFQLWADSADLNDVNFKISADDPIGFINIGSTPEMNTLIDFNFDADILDSTFYSIAGAGDVQIYVEFIGGRYLIEFIITPVVTSYYWRFTTKGSGYFDIWSSEATTGYSNFVTTGLPTEAILAEINNYQLPNTKQTIVSSWQCSDKVITVGSYVNRDTMTNYYGDMPPLIDVVGELFYSSSRGPTRDARIKPDICAPGARVLSTAATILTDWLISLGAANYMAVDGQHYLYNGTSFSSPAVAGIAALYLQKNPDAGYAEIKDAIISQARQDVFTGYSLPDNDWGYGKADAFRTLTGPWGCEADDYTNPPQNFELIDVTSIKAKIEWDIIPNAIGYQISYKKTGAAPFKIKSLINIKTLSGLSPASEYTCKVRAFCSDYGLSSWSSEIVFNTLPLKAESLINTLVFIYPNPASDHLYVDGAGDKVDLIVYNLLGENILEKKLNAFENDIDISSLANGIYQVVIYENENSYSQKIIVIK